MTEKKTFMIAEDHTILRDGLKLIITGNPDYEIVGEACDGIEATQIAAKHKPDLILMDLFMPRMNGIDAIREIRRISPDSKILVLTVHKAEAYVVASLEAGADGYLLKESTHAELLTAISHVLAGEHYLSPGVMDNVLEGYLHDHKQRKKTVHTVLDTLTTREKEVLKLVAEGYKNREISDYLCISVRTVQKHRDNLMKKLDLHSAAELTIFAIDKGLIRS